MKKRFVVLTCVALFAMSFAATDFYIQQNKPPVFPRPAVTALRYEDRLESLQLAEQAATTPEEKALIRDLVKQAVSPEDIKTSAPQFQKFYNTVLK